MHRFRVTTWIAVADFFVAFAVLSFSLYAAHRRPAEQVIQVEDEIRHLTESLRDELQKSGVPAETRAEDFAIVLPSLLFFQSGKSDIIDESKLTKVADALRVVQPSWRDNFVLVIQGHTDSRPPKATAQFRDNLELSRLRARAVEEALDRHGIRPPQFQLVSQGMGADYPVISNCTNGGDWIDCGEASGFRSVDELQKNRRIELKFGVFSGNRRPATLKSAASQASSAAIRSQ